MALMVLTMAVLGGVAYLAARRGPTEDYETLPIRVDERRRPRR